MPALQVDTLVACCDMFNSELNHCVHCCACCDKDNCLLLRSPASVHSCAQDSSVKNTEPFRIKPKPQSTFMCQAHVSFGFDSDQIFGSETASLADAQLIEASSLTDVKLENRPFLDSSYIYIG